MIDFQALTWLQMRRETPGVTFEEAGDIKLVNIDPGEGDAVADPDDPTKPNSEPVESGEA